MSAVLFDVDGTLVDTTYLHTVCWWRALVEHGRPTPMVDIHGGIGMGADQLLPWLLRGEVDPDEAERISVRHSGLFRDYWDHLEPTKGAADLLRACAKRGLTVVLATSAHPEELTALRRAIGADDAIAAATSADDVVSSKPAPDLLHRALDQAAVAPEDAMLVGDAIWDVGASLRAGLPCIALTCGGTSEAELRAAGALHVYPNPAALLAHLPSSPLAHLP
jgi:HAD superfamily hydrolase (TIGR01509 family)